MVNVLSLAGPGLKHDIQRALNVRNLDPKTALTKEQAAYIDHTGSYEPKPRLRDMDVQGIDQVMIIPTDIDTYPWLQNALGAQGDVQGLQRMGLRVLPGESRAALLRRAAARCRIPISRTEEVVPRRGQGMPRRADPADRCDGQLSDSAQVRTRVARDGRDRRGLRDASVPGLRLAQAAGLHRAVFRRRADRADRELLGLAAFVSDQRAGFPGGSIAVGHDGPDVGLLRALSEAQGRGVRGVIDLAQLHAR